MKRIPISNYPSQEEIACRIEELELRAIGLDPTSVEHRKIIEELASLRTYAAMKTWMRPFAPRPNSIKDPTA